MPKFLGWYCCAENTPVEILDRLSKEISAGLTDPTTKAQFADLGSTPFPGSPPGFKQFIAKETENWSKVVKFAGIKAD
jgi:tripartite-type tricarboxylate transporter receptor subunit TctC